MNNFIRIIAAILISLSISVGVFASDLEKDTASGKIQSGAISEIVNPDDVIDEKKEIKEEVTEAKKERIKQEISSYIIDSYKAQGDRILKDIDQTLQKTTPDKDDRIGAYKKIRTTLEARKNRNYTSKRVSETSKLIIGEFLSHMIESIDKRISELSK